MKAKVRLAAALLLDYKNSPAQQLWWYCDVNHKLDLTVIPGWKSHGYIHELNGHRRILKAEVKIFRLRSEMMFWGLILQQEYVLGVSILSQGMLKNASARMCWSCCKPSSLNFLSLAMGRKWWVGSEDVGLLFRGQKEMCALWIDITSV